MITYLSGYKIGISFSKITQNIIFLWLKDGSFSLSKQSHKSRSVLQDWSISLGLFRKGKTLIITKFHMTDLVKCSYSRERKTLSYS